MVKVIVLGVLCLFLAGCGQKGPLTLTKHNTKPASSKTTKPAQ